MTFYNVSWKFLRFQTSQIKFKIFFLFISRESENIPFWDLSGESLEDGKSIKNCWLEKCEVNRKIKKNIWGKVFGGKSEDWKF